MSIDTINRRNVKNNIPGNLLFRIKILLSHKKRNVINDSTIANILKKWIVSVDDTIFPHLFIII